MIYNKKVLKIFRNPKHIGEIKNPDGVGKVGNKLCGDTMYVYIKVKKEKNKEIIKNIKVKTFGCVAAISTSSILADMVKGKTIEKALKISDMDIVKKLGGLPKNKFHCSVLAGDALKKAIEDYKKKRK